MQKPQGYDEAQAFTGDFETLKAGGYICVIKKALVTTSSTGSEMLVLLFDIAEGEHKGYYQRLFDNANKTKPDAKWQGVYRQLTQGQSMPFFKGMITSIESSNPGYQWNWNEETLKGKLFGGVFGREQYENHSGELKWSTKCQSIRSVEAIKKGIDIPADKYLKASRGFTEVQIDDDELPF